VFRPENRNTDEVTLRRVSSRNSSADSLGRKVPAPRRSSAPLSSVRRPIRKSCYH